MYERILVPMDGSKNAHAALVEAIKLAQKLGSKLFIVSVASDQTYAHYGAEFGSEIVTHFKDAATKFLDSAVQEVEDAGVPVETSFKVGLPKPTIATTLPQELNTNLTVIGRSGVHGLGRAIMGSTTAYVVRNSETSVLVVD
ncbi:MULTISPECIES: universal stress protein [Levilactobacillus]|uniref:UspA family nucleotide-binding protein n=2 Tax=Levilactobacillus TaxID=2767886 RepID=A0A0R1LEI0_9LACO|nr:MULTISPECIES: universal stress protein [Levilactobacillus]KRK94031.1 UspA family nucleotide-binding protein [Levilactobacillus acidifarinae DSM 19394]KRL11171.1 UspA family nucleotide-binding protein [Levilactobacillus zymae DSM 19395]QFR60069.1 universal stress protein [Levilactobacillus zymae]GEO69804.1 universal stress protein UspA [Levilactobacillus acidifarinae]GEO71496.1 universal stress protein UspA [Levilactobacillus zymae]